MRVKETREESIHLLADIIVLKIVTYVARNAMKREAASVDVMGSQKIVEMQLTRKKIILKWWIKMNENKWSIVYNNRRKRHRQEAEQRVKQTDQGSSQNQRRQ